MELAMMKTLVEDALALVRSDRKNAAENDFKPGDWPNARSMGIEKDLQFLRMLIDAAMRDPAGATEDAPTRKPGRYMGVTGGEVPRDGYYE